jgi:uncharacterized protein (DUF1015 family)
VAGSDAIAPPYDVVGEEAEARLLARAPYNAAHVELAPGASEGRFARAAARFAHWREEGILLREPTPCFYLYEQEATIEGRRRHRRCFFAQVRLARPEEGLIRPHESTMAGPRAVRLELMRATGANISPIFSMFTDPEHRVGALLERTLGTPPTFEAIDDLKDVHRLWPIDDEATIGEFVAVLERSTVTIADGHHRYFTALDYSAEHPESEAARYVLMGLIDVDDPGLVILPNHRLVKTAPPADFVERLGERFEVTDVTSKVGSGVEGVSRLLERVRGLAGGPTTFGVMTSEGRLLVARGRSQEALDGAMPAELSVASKRLDARVLTQLVLAPLFGIDAAALTAGAVDFTADAAEAWELTTAGEYAVAFLVNGTPVQQVVDVADAGEVMPQKTTFFYPKLATGMVYSVLDE